MKTHQNSTHQDFMDCGHVYVNDNDYDEIGDKAYSLLPFKIQDNLGDVGAYDCVYFGTDDSDLVTIRAEMTVEVENRDNWIHIDVVGRIVLIKDDTLFEIDSIEYDGKTYK